MSPFFMLSNRYSNIPKIKATYWPLTWSVFYIYISFSIRIKRLVPVAGLFLGSMSTNIVSTNLLKKLYLRVRD